MDTLIAQTIRALECGTCGKSSLCISDKELYWIEKPRVFCSDKCLAEWERSAESWLEKQAVD